MLERIQQLKDAGGQAFEAGRVSEAIDAYGQAIQLSERHQQPGLLLALYSNRAAARLKAQDPAGALADAQAAVAIDDRWCKGWFRSAVALQALGDPRRALAMAARAAELEPRSPQVLQLQQQLQQQLVGSHAAQAAHQAAPSVMPAAGIIDLLGLPTDPPLLEPPTDPPRPVPPTAPLPAARSPPPGVGQAAAAAGSSSGAGGGRRARAALSGQAVTALLPACMQPGSRYAASPDGINTNLLLLLHGLGDRSDTLAALGQTLALPQTATLALSAPLHLPETDGGRMWFTSFNEDWELIQPRPGEVRRIESLDAAARQLLGLVSRLSTDDRGWWPRRRIHLFGFSQGGTVALEVVRRCGRTERLGSCVAVAASLLPEAFMLGGPLAAPRGSDSASGDGSGGRGGDANASNGGSGGTTIASSNSRGGGGVTRLGGTPVLITLGSRDPVVPIAAADRTLQALRLVGCPSELLQLPGKGHAGVSSPDEAGALMRFWARHLGSRPPGEGVVELSPGDM